MSTTPQSGSVRRALVIGASMTALMLTAWEGNGAARPLRSSGACAATYKTARALERAAHLREAQGLLLKCAQAACGSFLQRQCAARYTQIDSDIPTVVPTVIDDGGAPVIDARVTVDGTPLTHPVDGRAIPVDPGLHEFSFETSKGVFARHRLVILQGQRNRPVPATLASGAKTARGQADARRTEPDASAVTDPRPTPPEVVAATGRRQVSPAPPPQLLDETSVSPERAKASQGFRPYLLGGVGLAGLGGYALLTYWGRKDNATLAQCSPDCPPASADHIRKLYLAADVSLGVGLVAIAASTWLLLRSGSATEVTAGHRSSLALAVSPTATGGMALVSGAF